MPEQSSPSYWYESDADRQRSVRVLEAVRIYRAAEAAMRRRTRNSMGMGENDLLALRFLIRQKQQGHVVAPKDLSTYLGISSASTTILLDRLEKSGHLERKPSPFDRRSLIVEPTIATDTEVRATLGEMHSRMMAVASTLDDAQAETVIHFLEGMRDAVDQIDAHSS
ncbi:MarR family winged helix-turn-helix transcriptional regulator [Herbiconiux sp. SYSU D00978]|uniref:MarR family winged helix-turn-helix transcriptional regulator n=1 Tax=Herbiconiux sp. SYSU D00978 TaxID=2812562 RepID=UPI0027DD1D48|nr:MarR family transcriptional regulator [Herbiconiux sp. SYSU D00978]